VGTAQRGFSVAISADASTAIVGGAYDANYTGAVWIYIRASGGGWALPTKIVAGDAIGSGALQGWSVALSANGETAIVGGPFDGSTVGAGVVYDVSQTGAAWVVQRTAGGGWSQEKLPLPVNVVGGAHLGTSVSVSADGKTVLVGGPNDNGDVGAAWLYTRTSAGWVVSQKLVPTGTQAWQGQSVSLSGDGNTAIVGGPYAPVDGASWVYTRGSGGGWSPSPSELVGTPGVGAGHQGSQGSSVSLSYDGDTAIVGAPVVDDLIALGGAWSFARGKNGKWSKSSAPLIGTGAVGSAAQGWSTSVSADGNTVIVGGLGDEGGTGASWIYARYGTCDAVFFEPVGDLAGDCFSSLPTDVSSNGAYVVVNSSADDPGVPNDGGRCPPTPGVKHSNEAAGWTRPCAHLSFFSPPLPGAGGLSALGYLPGAGAAHDESYAYGISPAGPVVVGFSNYGAGNNTKAVVYEPAMIHELALLDPSAAAMDISQSGARQPRLFTGNASTVKLMSRRIVVGYSTTSNQEPLKQPGARAVFWDSWTHIEALPLPAELPNGLPIISSEAVTISDDGAMIGGNLYYDRRANPDHLMSYPCVWKRNPSGSAAHLYDLMMVLTDLPGGDDNARIARISNDGKLLVGWGNQMSGNPACWDYPTTACMWRWQAGGGPSSGWSAPTPLMPLSGYAFSAAHGTNGDGTVVVGTALNITGPCNDPEFDDQAVLWDGANPGLPPKSLAAILGPRLPSGWALFEAMGVSADGKIITGYGFNQNYEQEGWVAGVP
jgi:hypothetical protein